MFAFLRGVVARKNADSIELDVNGVGYEVHVPARVQHKLLIDSPATLLTYCHIREDAFTIFGFLREDDKALFKTLLTINGIGPRVALAVLSFLTVADLQQAVIENDVKALTKVPGVGKKMAQRLVLELHAKMGEDAELGAILGEGPAETDAEADDVTAALLALGCTHAEAKKAVEKARKTAGPDAPDEELVRAALRSLAKA